MRVGGAVLQGVGVVTILSCAVRPAWAACAKDIDCKGDLICQGGVCVAPSPSAPPPAVAPPAAPVIPPEKAACLEAASKGQTLRDAHKLVEAREQFRLCGRPLCPAMVQADCGTWLGGIEKSLPTVVVSAKNAAGAELVDVEVSVDGQLLVSKLDGRAVPTNPGPRLFHFALPDGTKIDQSVLVKEGEKNRAIAVVLEKPAAPPPPKPPVTTEPSKPETESPPAPVPPPPVEQTPAPPQGSSAGKTAGFVIGGVGIVGLGVGTALGIVAIGDKNGGHCVNNMCDPGSVSRMKSAALLSDVGLIAGGVLLAVGGTLVVLAPGATARGAASVRVSPTLTANGGGVVLGGRW